ncbi:MAG: hypothetical protein ABS949_18810 [Solibacillus sp.]
MSKRNPPWQKQEIILALELYLKNRKKGILSGRTPDMKDLAIELNELAKSIHYVPCERTSDSVYMKILNLVSLDESNSSNGRPSGGKLDKVVWEYFENNPLALKREAALIRESIQLRKKNISTANEMICSPLGRQIKK